MAEQIGEDIAEIMVAPRRALAVTGPLLAVGILTVELALGRMALAIDLASIKAGALLGVRQQLVRGRGRLEAPLSRGVTGIQVGVVLFRKFAERGLDRVGRRVLGHAQYAVRILSHAFLYGLVRRNHKGRVGVRLGRRRIFLTGQPASSSF